MTTDDFLTLVERSGLLPFDRIEPYIGMARSGDAVFGTPEGIARQLVRDRLITPFQGRQLLRGRYRGFFLGGKYKILEQIGEGGMGRVLLCEHLMLHKLVAVKLLQITGGNIPGAAERFLREARAAAGLDHPNITRVFDVDKAGNMPFMVMEYVDGSNLHVIVQNHGPLSVPRAAEYVRQSALGLNHAHEAGLIHRDIKPANLILDRAGTVKLLDLGLARFFDQSKNENLTRKFDEKSVLGTADFISPEQAMSSSKVDIRADVYSLGCTAYFLLTGRFPFHDGSIAQKLLAHQTSEPIPLRELRPDIPESLAAVVSKMMRKKPEDRFQTPAEVASALAPFAGKDLPPPPAAEMPKVRPNLYLLGLSRPPIELLADNQTEMTTPAPGAYDHPTGVINKGSRHQSGMMSGSVAMPPGARTPRSMAMTGGQPGHPSTADFSLPQTGGVHGPSGPISVVSGRSLTTTLAVLAGVLGAIATTATLAALGVFSGNSKPEQVKEVPATITAPLAVSDSTRVEEPTAAPAKKAEPTAAPLSGVALNGAGSSFVNPLMQEWAKQYLKQTGHKINYEPLGSGRGIAGVTEKLLDFGCSDAPMRNEELATARDIGGEIVHIPLAMGAVVPVYNVPGLTEQLKFTGPVLAQIFMGKITNWNDPSITTLNPNAGLPDDLPIVVVHRKDKSGTTFIWSDYLAKVYPEFKAVVGVGTAVKWPAGQREGEGNNGVAEEVNRTLGGIGYTELSYALSNGLTYGPVKNRAGRYPPPDFDSVTAAADASLQDIPGDLRYSLTDAPGAASYPICGTVWAMVYKNPPKGNGKELAEFFWWATHDGQGLCKRMMYAPLPPTLVAKCEEKIHGISGGGSAGSR